MSTSSAESTSTSTINVTLTISTDDISDTLAWVDGREITGDTNRLFLNIYDKQDNEYDRNRVWLAMPSALQYCLIEVFEGRVDGLRAKLAEHDA